MKKYLIRSDFDPLKRVDPKDYVFKDFVGANSGNLMFAYGVMNTLKTNDVQLEYSYKTAFSDSEIEYINSTFDAFIIPLADAFRADYVRQLSSYTNAIKRLRIPVIVSGVGLRTDYEPNFKDGNVFDDTVREFVKAVLEKSPFLGLRGEITSDYLEHLGFKAGRDHTPIGCPSLYTYGDSIRISELRSPIQKAAINTNGYYHVQSINEFINKTISDVSDYYLVQQIQDEFQELYTGGHLVYKNLAGKNKKLKNYIIVGKELDTLYKEDRVRFFFDVPSWINFMKPFDIMIGNRFHGTVAGVLAGIPSVMLPFNGRTRELVEYHDLTCLHPKDIRPGTSILDYVDKLDFHSFEKKQPANLKHYIDFLDKNGLEHIFKTRTGYKMGESPLEKSISCALHTPIQEYCYEVHCYNSLNCLQKAKRWSSCNSRAAIRKLRSLRRRFSNKK
ncbi:MAG: polysaccharide pyruvyl transferase family protein [Clostridia bacterium]|nr:polysaccharide pyruvyl transferase family protein [Clostridia bacterium]